jgi:capsular exopolysaccharide synthesis family protein
VRAWNLFSRRKKKNAEDWNIRTMFGPNLNFSTMEAYKLLRTNIMFSFSEEGKGHVIGITSAIPAEGKSSTACNTAYALSEVGSKVLLLECDLRRPSIANKLNVNRVPGLSNILVSKIGYNAVVQRCSLAPSMDILTGGDIPPNPSELLTSVRMERLMEQLRNDYDYIIIDLPPVTAVSDALAITKLMDGVVMVVRDGASDQQMLFEAMRQLEMVNARVLGFVYRDSDGSDKKYSRRYSKKYYKYYTKYNKDYAK